MLANDKSSNFYKTTSGKLIRRFKIDLNQVHHLILFSTFIFRKQKVEMLSPANKFGQDLENDYDLVEQ